MQRLLLADSDQGMVQAVSNAAAEYGLELVSTHVGQWVVDLAAALRPALIVVDVIQLDSDGRDILAELKGDPRTALIPVLLWSKRGESESDRRLALELGAEDYIQKIDADAMLAKAKRVLLRFERPSK